MPRFAIVLVKPKLFPILTEVEVRLSDTDTDEGLEAGAAAAPAAPAAPAAISAVASRAPTDSRSERRGLIRVSLPGAPSNGARRTMRRR